MENNKHAGVDHSVHDAVVLLDGDGSLGWWHDHVLLANSEIPRQHSAEVHKLLPLLIWLGVGVTGRVAGIDSKVRAITIACSIFSSVTPVEAEFIDCSHCGTAGSVEKTSLVVQMTISHLHVTPLDLKTLPKYRVLDPLNLSNRSIAGSLEKIQDFSVL